MSERKSATEQKERSEDQGHIVLDKVFAYKSICWAKEFVMESAVGSEIGILKVRTVVPSFDESLQLFL